MSSTRLLQQASEPLYPGASAAMPTEDNGTRVPVTGMTGQPASQAVDASERRPSPLAAMHHDQC